MLKQQYYSPAELAVELGVHYSTIWRWIKDGTITAYKFGGQWRIPHNVIEEIKKERGNR